MNNQNIVGQCEICGRDVIAGQQNSFGAGKDRVFCQGCAPPLWDYMRKQTGARNMYEVPTDVFEMYVKDAIIEARGVPEKYSATSSIPVKRLDKLSAVEL